MEIYLLVLLATICVASDELQPISEQKYSSVPSLSCRNNTNEHAPNNKNRSEAIDFSHLSYVINEYKTYIIANLADNIRKQKCIGFLNQITNRGKVKDLYDAFGFVNELLCLEREYFASKNKNELKQFLESFRQRISDGPLESEVRFILDSGLWDILSVKDYKSSVIVDLKTYTEVTSEMIEKYEALESQPETSNPELSNAIMELKREIQSELVLDDCKHVMNRVKQHYFPLVSYLYLPMNSTVNDRNSMTDTCIRQFKNTMKTIKDRKLPAEFYNYMENSTAFNGTDQPPFYVWKYDSIKNQIEKLLSGEKIIIKSDIAGGVNLNAVKFNKIWLRFKLHNSSMQNEFEGKVFELMIRLEMKGSFDYRCNDRIYPMSYTYDDTWGIKIFYRWRQIGDFIHYSAFTEEYGKIMENPAFLSPYGEWSMQLADINGFKNEEIDLELHGHGTYLPRGQFSDSICNDQLDEYYGSVSKSRNCKFRT